MREGWQKAGAIWHSLGPFFQLWLSVLFAVFLGLSIQPFLHSAWWFAPAQRSQKMVFDLIRASVHALLMLSLVVVILRMNRKKNK